MLVDQYNRRFTYLRLSVTDVCNFRCNYCLPDGYSASDCKENRSAPLSLDEIRSLVEAFAANGTKKIRLTGGEPTLRKDLADIIRACKSTPGIETVALTTNGYRITKQLDSYIDAGLDSLNLSADSLTPETFQLITGHNSLDEVFRAIDIAVSRNMKKIKVNAVLLRQYNGGELQRYLDFVKNKPITLRFIELMQTGDNHDFFSEQHLSGEMIQQQLVNTGWLPVIQKSDAGPAIEYTHPDSVGNIGLIMPYSKDFCASCNRLRVSSQGNLHLCLFADDKQALRPHILTDTQDQLSHRIRNLVMEKNAQHALAQGHTGSTKHLAMLGG